MEKRFPGHHLADRLDALEYVLHELVKTLHEQGQLDIAALCENLSNAEWLFQGSAPGIQAEVLRLRDGFEDTRVRALPRDPPEGTKD